MNTQQELTRRGLLRISGMAGLAIAGGSLGTSQAQTQNAIPMTIQPISISQLRQSADISIDTIYYITDTRQEGEFIADSTDTTSPDNNGTVLVSAGGIRFKRIFSGEVNARWFGARGDGVNDDTAAVQAAINSLVVPTEGPAANGGGVVYLPKGKYRITATIYLDKFIKLRGDLSRGGYFFQLNTPHVSGTVIYADFTNPEQIAVDACGYVKQTGQRVGVKQIISGKALDGSRQISGVHGVCIEDLVVYTDKNAYCGIRYCGTPNSKMRNVHSRGFEVGILFNAGWGCSFDDIFINALYHGFAAINDINGCVVTSCYIDIMGDRDAPIPADRIPPYVYSYETGNKDANPSWLKEKKVCTYHNYCFAINYVSPVFEHSQVGVVSYNSNILFTSPYLEGIREVGIFAVASTINAHSMRCVMRNADLFYAGTGARVNLEFALFEGSNDFRRYFAYVSSYSQSNRVADLLSDKTEYSPYVDYQHLAKQRPNNDIYIDPQEGNDALLGFSPRNAIKTLSAAVLRVRPNLKNVIWIKAGQKAVSNVFHSAINDSDVEFKTYGEGKGILVAKLAGINNGLTLNNSKLTLNNIDLETENAGNDVSYRSLFYLKSNCDVAFINVNATLSPNTSLFQPLYGTAATARVIYQKCSFSAPEGNARLGANVYQSQGKVVLQQSSIDSTFQNGLENNYAAPAFQVLSATNDG